MKSKPIRMKSFLGSKPSGCVLSLPPKPLLSSFYLYSLAHVSTSYSLLPPGFAPSVPSIKNALHHHLYLDTSCLDHLSPRSSLMALLWAAINVLSEKPHFTVIITNLCPTLVFELPEVRRLSFTHVSSNALCRCLINVCGIEKKLKRWNEGIPWQSNG